jgi:hypothetical protein
MGLTWVARVQGMVQGADGSLTREYALVELEVPAAIIVERVEEEDPRYQTRKPLALEVRATGHAGARAQSRLILAWDGVMQWAQAEAPLGTTVIYLGTPEYGRLATVLAHRAATRTLDVRLAPDDAHPQLAHQALASAAAEAYVGSNDAARRVGLPASVLGRLTGMLYVVREQGGGGGRGRVNIGLGLKVHSKMLRVRTIHRIMPYRSAVLATWAHPLPSPYADHGRAWGLLLCHCLPWRALGRRSCCRIRACVCLSRTLSPNMCVCMSMCECGRRLLGTDVRAGALAQVVGYARYRNDSWEYSAKALALLTDYQRAFPRLFSSLAGAGGHVDEYYEDDLFAPGGPANQGRGPPRRPTTYLGMGWRLTQVREAGG